MSILEIYPSGDGIGQRAHLFVDFFGHKVAVLAFFCCHRVPRHGVDLCRHGPTFQSLHLHPLAGDNRHLARLQKDHPPGMFQDSRQVGGHEHLAFAQADHHAAGVADARGDDLIRFFG